jgi:hypothetical protein
MLGARAADGSPQRSRVGVADGRGIVPRALSELFGALQPQLRSARASEVPTDEADAPTAHAFGSCVEIYQDHMADMLVAGGRRSLARVELHETPSAGVFTTGLTHVDLTSEAEALQMVRVAHERRSTERTNANAQSSRSHLVVMFEVSTRDAFGCTSTRKLTMVDLAGSERVAKTGAADQTLEEAKHINKSLSAFGNVIRALSDGAAFVPYRDSKLTRLLQPVLGGSAKTMIVINCSLAASDLEETVSSLHFAKRCSSIASCPVVHKRHTVESLEALVLALQQELMQMYERPPPPDPSGPDHAATAAAAVAAADALRSKCEELRAQVRIAAPRRRGGQRLAAAFADELYPFYHEHPYPHALNAMLCATACRGARRPRARRARVASATAGVGAAEEGGSGGR